MLDLGELGIAFSGLAWYIAGLVWRFNASGSFASGDVMPAGYDEATWDRAIQCKPSEICLFQYSSGKFMYIFFLITWIFMGVACACYLIRAVHACVCAPKNDSNYSEEPR